MFICLLMDVSLPMDELRLAAVAESMDPPGSGGCLTLIDPLEELPSDEDAWPAAAPILLAPDADDLLPPFDPPEPEPEIMLLKDLDPMLLPAVAAPLSGGACCCWKLLPLPPPDGTADTRFGLPR
jgi:hypothetical protein